MSDDGRDEVKRDPALAEIYRAARDEAPPPSLDAAILAAAHREVGARPRAAGRPFARAWRGALSVAAVLVLSVSLVIVMREESPDVLSPHGRDEMQDSNAKLLDDDSTNKNREQRAAAPAADAQTPKSVGLKSSSDMPPSGLGMRQPSVGGLAQPTSKDKFAADPQSPPAGVTNLAKRREGFAESNEVRADRTAPESKQERLGVKQDAAKEVAKSPLPRAAEPVPERQMASGALVAGKAAEAEAPPKVASVLSAPREEADAAARAQARDNRARSSAADSLSAAAPPVVASAPVTEAKPAPPPASPAPAPQAKPMVAPAAKPEARTEQLPVPQATLKPAPAQAPQKLQRDLDLSPEKWLERIEELRKQGRLDEARASLVEFKKRYPDYRLPESLRDGIK